VRARATPWWEDCATLGHVGEPLPHFIGEPAQPGPCPFCRSALRRAVHLEVGTVPQWSLEEPKLDWITVDALVKKMLVNEFFGPLL